MTKLRISTDLALPLDAVTQKLGFMGRTGSGKSYAATKTADTKTTRRVINIERLCFMGTSRAIRNSWPRPGLAETPGIVCG